MRSAYSAFFVSVLCSPACATDDLQVATGDAISASASSDASEGSPPGSDTSDAGSGSTSTEGSELNTSSTPSESGDSSSPPMDCEIRLYRDDGTIGDLADLVAECEAGFPVAIHRPVTRECEPGGSAPACSQPGGECAQDADCDALVGGGLCASLDGLGGGCRCLKDCSSDADCPADRACLCRSAVILGGTPSPIVSHTACWPAGCREDSDCGSEGQCALPNPLTVCSFDYRLACRAPGSGCQSDATCAGEAGCGHAPSGTGWTCVEGSCQ